VETNSVWETVRENINISVKESLGYFQLKKHKLWFDEGCSELLVQRKQTKLQWLLNPSIINGNKQNNVKCEASRHLKHKIKDLATNSKNKNIRDLYRGINEFKRGYQPRNNRVKNENGHLLTDFHNIFK
jgi:hypothetical protein